MNIRKIVLNANMGIELCRKLSEILNSYKAISENYERMENEYKFMKCKVNLYETIINKQYKEFGEIMERFGNPCPNSEWTPCSAEWAENEGWVKVNAGSSTQYFKLDKIEINYE